MFKSSFSYNILSLFLLQLKAIHGYRETERRNWTQKNKAIIQRIRDQAFPSGVSQLANVHVLDLQKEGVIKPHVDAVKVTRGQYS